MKHPHGTPLAWASDLALLGLICGVACPGGAKLLFGSDLHLGIPAAFLWVSGLTGSVSGALFGALVGWILQHSAQRTPIWLWGLPLWVGFGAWGGLTVTTPTILYAANLWPFALAAGVFSGLAQGAWSIPLSFWAFRRGWPRWPMHLVAGVLGVPVGIATIFVVPMSIGWLMLGLRSLLGLPY